MASFDLEKEMADALARIKTKRPCQKEVVAKAAAPAAPVKRPVASPAASKTLPPVVSPPIKSPDTKKVRLATVEPDEEEDPTPETLCDSPTPMASTPPGEKGTPVTPRDLTPEFDAMLNAVEKTPVSAQRVQEVMDSPAELPPYETGSQSFFDEGARLRLGRSKSLEDIVCSPHVEDLVRDSSLSLNMALLPYFERGWDPEKFGRYKLEEATVSWLKGLNTIPLKERQTMPEVVADALVAFQELRTSSEELEKAKANADKVNSAAAKTAEVKFQTYLAEMLQSAKDQDAVKEELQSRKKLLESWVNQCREKGEMSVEKREAVHVEVRSAFENLVVGLVLSSHKEFKEKKLQAASARDDDLIAELEAELLMCIDTPNSAGPQRDDVPTSQHEGGEPTPCPDLALPGGKTVPAEEATETPPMMITNTYEAMKLAIDNVVAQSHIPDEVRNALVGSVQNLVKNCLEGGHAPVPVPNASTPTQPLPDGQPMDHGSPPAPAAGEVPTVDLAKDEPEVKKADGSAPSGVEAVSKELQRKDTTQNQFFRANTRELEADELQKCAVLMDDGTYKYMNKRGKLESLEEREKRLAHNSYVAFSRSFEGPGCPPEVLEKAAGRRHNRHLLQQLYEDWLCAKGDWSKSATYSNACEQFNSTKRGRYVYKSFKDLTDLYGLPIAKDIRLKKKEAEKSRAAHEEAFWLKHPEVPDNEEYELFRVWDSLVLEDEEMKKREWGVRHDGHMEGEASRGLLQRLLSDKGFAGSFPQPGDAKQRDALPPPGEGASPNQNVPKAKAKRKSKKGKGGEEGAGDQEENPVVKHNKKVSNKITSLSTKLTEVRCIMTQVQNANMTQAMKDGYLGELTAIQNKLNDSKMKLEEFYSERHDDKNIVGELKDKMDKLIGSADTIILSFASGTKIVKAAVAPPKQRAKAKAAPTSPKPSVPAAVAPAAPEAETVGVAAVKQEAS